MKTPINETQLYFTERAAMSGFHSKLHSENEFYYASRGHIKKLHRSYIERIKAAIPYMDNESLSRSSRTIGNLLKNNDYLSSDIEKENDGRYKRKAR